MIFVIIILIIILIIFLVIFILRQWNQSQERPSQFYVCLDGHLVRSRGEWMIDATLQYLGIPHEYEPRLQIGRHTIHPDFELGRGVFLEYWGLRTQNYLKIKKWKHNIYKNEKIQLINIENTDLKNILHVLTSKLQDFEVKFPQFHNLLELTGFKNL